MKYKVKQSIVKDGAASVTFECGLCCEKTNSGGWLYYVAKTIKSHPDKDEIKKAIESHFGNDEEFRETFGGCLEN